MAQRIADIPAEVKIRNVTDEEYSLRGITSVGPNARMTINLRKHPEKVRAALWQSVKNGVFGRILVIESNTPVTVEPVETALEDLHSQYPGQVTVDSTGRVPATIPPEPRKDVFLGVGGINEFVQQRLYGLGIDTFEKFLNTDEQVLLKVEGITESNLTPMIEAIVTKFPVPEVPKENRSPDPKPTLGMTPGDPHAEAPDGDNPAFSGEMPLGD